MGFVCLAIEQAGGTPPRPSNSPINMQGITDSTFKPDKPIAGQHNQINDQADLLP